MINSAVAGADPDSIFFQRARTAVSSRMPGLDALRGIAILLVIFHNIGSTVLPVQAGLVLKSYLFFVDAGWVGVQLFFVLSGFLITGILLDGRGTDHQLRNFYARRTLRIFPLYYVTLLVAFVLLPALGLASHWLDHDRAQQFWYWSYLINWVGGDGSFTHFWSLAVEEQFYLLWPLAVVVLNRRNLMWLCLLLIVSAPLWRVLALMFMPEHADVAAYSFTCARWDALAMGALLALVLRQHEACAWLHRYSLQLGIVAAVGIAASVIINRDFTAASPQSLGLNQSLAGFWCSALLFYTVVPIGGWTQILSWFDRSPFQFIGKYSYAIYVFHLPVAHFWFARRAELVYSSDWRMLLEKLYDVAGVFAGSLLLALVSWYVWEQPWLRLKHHFKQERMEL